MTANCVVWTFFINLIAVDLFATKMAIIFLFDNDRWFQYINLKENKNKFRVL